MLVHTSGYIAGELHGTSWLRDRWRSRAGLRGHTLRVSPRANTAGGVSVGVPATIVGGGIHGVATALELARRGLKVTLLEAREVASGASGGLGERGVRANGRDPRELPLMALAHSIWPRLADELGADTGYRRIGHLRLYETAHEAADAEVRAEIQTRCGVQSERLDAEATRALEPGVSDMVLGAVHCPADGVADHTATTLAYAEAAKVSGVEIQTGARVTRLDLNQGRCAGLVLDDEGYVETGGPVLLLANCGVPPLLAGATGLKLPIWTVYPQVLMSTPLSPPLVATLIGHASRPLAVKTVADGAVMLSGGWRGAWNVEAGRAEVLPAAVRGNWEQAVAVFPAAAELDVAHAVADRPESVCVDGIPVVDRLPGVRNLWFATGWTGHGWALAPAMARLLADWVVEDHHPDRLEPFGLRRFGWL